MIPQQIANGIVIGSVYALVALGFTLIYGIVRLINFAQVSLYAVGGYLGVAAYDEAHRLFGWSASLPTLILAVLIGGALTGAIGMAVEVGIYRPLRGAPLLAMLVASLAVLIFMENVIQVIAGPNTLTVPSFVSAKPFTVAGASITPMQVVMLVTALSFMMALTLLVERSRLGRAMRTLAADHEVARLMGVDVDLVITLTFVIAAVLVGVAGILVSANYGITTPTFGDQTGLKGFTAAVLGGMGRIPGAVVGGFTLGLIESLSTLIIPTAWTTAVSFGVLIAFLALRPTGILGERVVSRT
jgi:branched-chain amino acid transport system permease protein